jgi:hypothetical protein
MNTGDDRQTETESTADTKTRHKKRPRASPVLVIESPRHTAAKGGAVENAIQGPAS